MSRSPVAIIALALALAAATGAPEAQRRATVPVEVYETLLAGPTADVIVGVDTSFTPEGYLSAADVTAQRETIQRALDDTMGQARSAGIDVGSRLDHIAFFRARVNSATIEVLASLPGVRSIEANALHRPDLAASVPLINAPVLHGVGNGGGGWSVAILDTGVQSAHPFFGGRIVSEACYSNNGGAGTGGSACPGGAGSSTAPGSGAPCAANGCEHGTHVAGISAGAGGPGGANGVAPAAGIIAVQVFTNFGFAACNPQPSCPLAYTSDINNGLGRVLTLAGAGNVNRVASVNMSLGGSRFFSQASCDASNASTKAAIDNLRSIGVATVISSGNNGYLDSLGAPGCISSAVSVGSTVKTAPVTVSSFSNAASFLALLAPGGSISSSVPGGGFSSFSGTSMAAPHVAGLWALLKRATPSASVPDVLNALQGTGTTITDQRTGAPFKLVNAGLAAQVMAGAPGGGVPGWPRNLLGSVGGNILSLSWLTPLGGGAPAGYNLVARTSPGGPVVASLPMGMVTNFSLAIPNGTYTVSVQAVNGAGAGAESNGVQVTAPAALAPPGSPTNLAVSLAGTNATFTWNAPVGGGPVANYVLAAGLTPNFVFAAALLPLPPTPTTATITGIPPGLYYVRLFAQNAAGNSPFSTNEVTVNVAPPTLPGAPVLNPPVVSPGGGVSLSWSPGPGGAPTSYTLFASLTPGGPLIGAFPLTGTSASFTGVPSGTYYLRMTASNVVGTGPLSNQQTLVVP